MTEHSHPALPKNKADLLDQLSNGRKHLQELVDALNDDQILFQGADGWSVKDHLAHLAMWEVGIAALLRKQPRWEAMGLDRDSVNLHDTHSMNATLDRKLKDLSLVAVKDLFQRSHRMLLTVLGELSDDDLQKTYSYYQPDEPGKDSGAPIIGWIVGNTYGHYNEHVEWIRALVERA